MGTSAEAKLEPTCQASSLPSFRPWPWPSHRGPTVWTGGCTTQQDSLRRTRPVCWPSLGLPEASLSRSPPACLPPLHTSSTTRHWTPAEGRPRSTLTLSAPARVLLMRWLLPPTFTSRTTTREFVLIPTLPVMPPTKPGGRPSGRGRILSSHPPLPSSPSMTPQALATPLPRATWRPTESLLSILPTRSRPTLPLVGRPSTPSVPRLPLTSLPTSLTSPLLPTLPPWKLS